MSNIILAAAPDRKIKILYFKIDDKFLGNFILKDGIYI